MKKRWFFILRKTVDRAFSGVFQSKRKGADGIEFAGYREFRPGDSARSISYRESLKHFRYYVRDNILEKGMSSLFIIDCSASINFGASGISKRKIEDRILRILAPAIAQNNNRVGFLLITDKLEKYLEPRFGESLVNDRLRFIVKYEPASKKTDLNLAFRSVIKLNIQTDLIFVLSDFYASPFEDSLKTLNGKYDIIPLILKDPFETTTFPRVKGGMIPFKDMETGEFFWGEAPQKISNVKLFKSLGLDYVLLKTNENENDWVGKLMILFEQRKKRRRMIR